MSETTKKDKKNKKKIKIPKPLEGRTLPKMFNPDGSLNKFYKKSSGGTNIIGEEFKDFKKGDLIKRLQEYQIYKTVSEEIANLDRVNRDFFLASAGMPRIEKKTNVIDFNVARLKASMVEVLSRPKLDKSHQIEFEELSTEARFNSYKYFC